jgi:hypothetical protein
MRAILALQVTHSTWGKSCKNGESSLSDVQNPYTELTQSTYRATTGRAAYVVPRHINTNPKQAVTGIDILDQPKVGMRGEPIHSWLTSGKAGFLSPAFYLARPAMSDEIKPAKMPPEFRRFKLNEGSCCENCSL